MDSGGKRKRLLEHPRIIYHADNRTFDRLFKEKSLSEMKDVVRKKLELAVDAVFTLAQLRGDTFVDLEDDDDFEAFDALAHTSQSVEVRISVSDPSQEEDGSNADTRRRHVAFLERKDASKQQKTPAPEDTRPPPSKRRKLNNGKNEDLQSEDDKSSNEVISTKQAAPTTRKPGKKGKSANVSGTDSITAALNISAAANSSTEAEISSGRPKRRRDSVTEPTPASKLKEQVEAPGSPPAKPKKKKAKHKKTAIDDGSTADVETDSLNLPTNETDSTKTTAVLPRQRRKSVSKPITESKGNVDEPKDDAPEKPPDQAEPAKTRAATKALAKQDAPQPTETSNSATSKKKSGKKVTTDETPAPRATSTSRKKTKASRPMNDEPVSKAFEAAAATLKSWSVAPSDTPVTTPPPPEPPAKAIAKSCKDVTAKGEKKNKAKKVNGHSICPPPSAQDSAPESDIVPPVAGPSSESKAKRGVVTRLDESSDSDSSSSDVPLQRRIVKTTTKPTKEEKFLEEVVRGPRKSRASVARFLSRAEKEEAQGVDGKEDDGEALEEEEEQKKTLKRKKTASSSSDSEDVEMEDLSKDTTPPPDLSQPPPIQVQPSTEEPHPPIQQPLQPPAEIVQEDVAPTILAPDSSDDIESTHTSPDAVDDIQPSHDFPAATPTPTVKVMNRMKGKSPAKTPSVTNGHDLTRVGTQSPAIARKLLGTTSSSEAPAASFADLAKESQTEAQKDSQGSVAQWTPLMPKSPSSVPESMMEDELASSPRDVLKARQAEQTQLPDSDRPALFLDSASQTQFPYTQTVIRSPSPLQPQLPDSDEDEEENEVAAAVKVPAPQFRRLTEIEVSSRSMFAKTAARKKSSAAGPAAGMRTRSMNNVSLYGTLGSQRDDSDSDADSGSEEEKASHIPKSRRAGVK